MFSIQFLTPQPSPPLHLPLYTATVSAGFPSPADDYLERSLDLNEYLVEHPAATFLARAEGDSMVEAGIHSGDLLVVDRSLEPRDDDIVVAVVNGESTVKRLCYRGDQPFLVPANPSYATIALTDSFDVQIWGVVKFTIRHHRKPCSPW
ncbi:UmuD protein (plasmid) [Leptolyngbya boryana NIES-2135]|jgi:DNA polymerase V|uniref:UmuD protein n=1 Tax=Leptolyngbya boryana NIES-2135 TaxID=1973484 RepID=A0A1Z4JRF5_LEPBY|nr:MULTISPECIES: translesion error-prone DNA polymerase V autoproteolytic subunit [Leptolyngbya]BAY59243.1 UmuD protein [Leptolyngbya boryana NIES-2135]MBD2372832.1 translesion error-prone DNA polymerase V autoproteolytic subunit [Leptolyngbya sp. FACHB-238]MBD2397415.1 translesion error-prone DNA polymerase V autoproteolytic subunit [Leptolyngbya sp. FACHB-239]MBD2403780.1 translesion error-prone DNA polymerase V autoproteolytic subunit [Leptolyngbya sp. FACHB-402]ULP33436.1 translesion error